MSGISGVLIELAAIGNQDSYLNIRPRLTLFRGSYRRITNFAWCPIDQQFASAPILGGTSNLNLPRAGDLVAQMYVRMLLPRIPFTAMAAAAQVNINLNPVYANGAGYAALQDTQLTIGGYPFDTQSGMYMYLWNQLSHKAGAQEKVTVLQGPWDQMCQGGVVAAPATITPGWTQTAGTNAAAGDGLGSAAGQPLYVPLSYWFNRFYAQALPMIALQYHEVKLDVQFNTLFNIIAWQNLSTTGGAGNVPTAPAGLAAVMAASAPFAANVVANYVFLDTVERRLFAATPHEYLIDQTHAPDGVNGRVYPAATLAYQPIVNHPVKEFLWAMRLPVTGFGGTPTQTLVSGADDFTGVGITTSHQFFDLHGLVNTDGVARLGYAPHGLSPTAAPLMAAGAPIVPLNADNWGYDTFQTAGVTLNGNDRLTARNPTYFREVVQREVHTSVSSLNGNACGFQVYNYSFAVDPEDWKPSGSCNFSRIDTVTVNFTGLTPNSTLYFFYRNFNVMKIVAGMAGLRYAN